MIQYQPLNTLQLNPKSLSIRCQRLPELVHLEDPAWSVMRDFRVESPTLIRPHESIDNALMEMKIQGTHILLTTDTKGNLHGIISTEDILGKKPITITQSRRIERQQITIEMIMSPINEILFIDTATVQSSKVGNIVNTLKKHNKHYALVVHQPEGLSDYQITGLFSTSQISKQLHMEIAAKESHYSISKLASFLKA